MDKKEISEIFNTALTRTDGNKERAEVLLNAYLKGFNEGEMIRAKRRKGK